MKARLTLKVLTASLLLASCAQTQNRQDLVYIQPLQDVRHSYEQAKAQYELGRYFHGQLRYERAIEAYRRALELNPGMVDAMNAMGAAYAESGDFPRAREQFEAALKLQPKSVYTYNNLGFVNYLAGDYPAAVQAYKQALRLDGNHEKARQNLVLVMDRMGAGEAIARSEAQAPRVAAQPAAAAVSQEASQTAWVEVSPSIYEVHSAAVPAANPPVAEAAAVSGAVTNLPVPAVPVSVAARPLGEKLSGVEVSNGNGTRGMAAMVARYFSGKGIQQARLTNQKPFTERRTRIEYRPGSAEEAARINALLPQPAPEVASSNLRGGIRVRLVLGHDLGRDVASWNSPAEKPLVASLTGPELPPR